MFLVGLGEELWKKFLPKYLEALGAAKPIIGLFGTAHDFFDAMYQYPGGWIANHPGRRRTFLIFLALASAGYLVYLLSPSWPWPFVGLALVMAWQSMGSPQSSPSSVMRCRRNVGHGVHSAVDSEASADCDRSYYWRHADRETRHLR